MHLENLSLIQFKNYTECDLSLSPKLNCFIGNNGAGKTNILDAVYYLSFCKSFFNHVDQHNIRYGDDFFVIQGRYERLEKPEQIYCGVKRNQKKVFKRNKKEYGKLSEHIGLFPLVMISPYDTGLIHEGSEERRKFIDGVISQFDAEYLHQLIRYQQVLNQRNKLLKEPNAVRHAATFEVYNQQLDAYGHFIHQRRQSFLDEIIPVFQSTYTELSLDREEVSLQYHSPLHQKRLADLLEENFSKDLVLQYTSKGIQKDDLLFELNGHSLRKSGSQGQQKTFLISLKLAQYAYMAEKIGLKPLLLLDDLFDKLDSDRVERIIQKVSRNSFGQIFITDTNKNRISALLKKYTGSHHLFEVDKGAVVLKEE